MSVLGWAGGVLGVLRRGVGGVGGLGEREAGRHLRRKGFRVLGRNVRVGVGEADLVCLDPDGRTIVIVEVKTRIAGDGPPPEASVTAHKQRKLRQVARAVLRRGGWEGRPCRIDVVGVDLGPDGRRVAEVRHRAGAVSG